MKDRIYSIMQKEGLTNAEFADKIGISTSSLSHIFSGRNKPSLDVVMRIQKAYPSINLNWLLYGEGDMNQALPSQPAGIQLVSQAPENPENTDLSLSDADFRKQNCVYPPNYGSEAVVKEQIKYVEKPHPRITEIRIFFDNGTYEVFKPDR
ncbi:MAG: helix-turn-helix domain-containing protein [Phocaeicola plebeius]|nr:helix-turn-helix domain-containing protein [Phocaeicola plebeius]